MMSPAATSVAIVMVLVLPLLAGCLGHRPDDLGTSSGSASTLTIEDLAKAGARRWGMGLQVPPGTATLQPGELQTFYPTPAYTDEAADVARLRDGIDQLSRHQEARCGAHVEATERHLIYALGLALDACWRQGSERGDQIAALPDRASRNRASSEVFDEAEIALADIRANITPLVGVLGNVVDAEVVATVMQDIVGFDQAIAEAKLRLMTRDPRDEGDTIGNLASGVIQVASENWFLDTFEWRQGRCEVDEAALESKVVKQVDAAYALADALPRASSGPMPDPVYQGQMAFSAANARYYAANNWWPGLLREQSETEWMVAYWTEYTNLTLPTRAEAAFLIAQHEVGGVSLRMEAWHHVPWIAVAGPKWENDYSISNALLIKTLSQMRSHFDELICQPGNQ